MNIFCLQFQLVNKEMFWVVTEVCSESNLVKRAKLLKHFIKIASKIEFVLIISHENAVSVNKVSAFSNYYQDLSLCQLVFIFFSTCTKLGIALKRRCTMFLCIYSLFCFFNIFKCNLPKKEIDKLAIVYLV